jgi:hypothetical protein
MLPFTRSVTSGSDAGQAAGDLVADYTVGSGAT